eukprot:tig00020610_g11960.t1
MAPSSGLPAERVAQLRAAISDHLRQANVYSQIREFVSSFVQQEGSGSTTADERLVQAMHEKGLVADILRSLGGLALPPAPQPELEPPAPAAAVSLSETALETRVLPTRRYLHFKLLGGKAFVDALTVPAAERHEWSVVVHAQFEGQRFRSRPAPLALEPGFTDAFLIELPQDPDSSRPTAPAALLECASPLQVAVTATAPDGHTRLVGTHALEWRRVLKAGQWSVALELASGAPEGKGTAAGSLEARLELLPRPQPPDLLPAADIDARLQAERAREGEAERRFYAYARAWWKDYLQVRPQHTVRLCKIFAPSEDGAQRPVVSFVRPLRAGRLLDSPRHAARFVSLLPVAREEAVGGGPGRPDLWLTPHTFLCKGSGDVADHAVLLCSLLLGFNLDAYVAIGTDGAGPHAWVVTRGPGDRVTFWESTTGVRYAHGADAALGRRYRTVGCLFNHRAFYANNQPSDEAAGCSFELEDPALWRPMDPAALAPLRRVPGVALVASTVPAQATEEALEAALRSLVDAHRRSSSLGGAVWDEGLAYLLAPALSAYEHERLTGVALAPDDFQLSIKRAVPEGHTFKAFPIQFAHHSPQRAMAALLRARAAADILATRGDMVRFALRARVFTYPEGACAVWVMLAVQYLSVGA